MKKTRNIFAFLFAFVFINACKKDSVAQPQAIQNSNSVSVTYRKVLLENFHGHTCPNTVFADRAMDSLAQVYDSQFVAINIHAGWFAEPCPPHPLPSGAGAGSFIEDWNSPAGTAIFNQMNPGAITPVAMINRRGFPNWHLNTYNNWGAVVDSLLQIPADVSIQMNAQLDTVTNLIDVTASGNFITAQNGSFSIAVMLVQDSLTGWQIQGTAYNSNYIFRNVLRACLTDSVNGNGAVIANGVIPAMAPFSHTISNFTLPSNISSPQRLYAVAFVYNNATKEILQAEKVRVFF